MSKKEFSHNMTYVIDHISLREIPTNPKSFQAGITAQITAVKHLAEDVEKARQLSQIGVWSRIVGDLDQSTSYLQAAAELLKKLGQENSRLAKVNCLRQAQTLQFQGNYKAAEAIYNTLAKQILEDAIEKDQVLLDFIYQHQGKNYFEWGKYQQALEYIQKAITIRAKKGNKELLASSRLAYKTIEAKMKNKGEIII